MAPQDERTKGDHPYADVTLIKFRATDPANEVIQMGPIRLDILEDGRNTDNRLGALVVTLPPGTPGPLQHWHQMHDETFLVLKGQAYFSSRDKTFTADVGDYVVVPPYAPHTFGNASKTEEVAIYNTFTPAFYVNYFRLTARMMKECADRGEKWGPEGSREAMGRYATLHYDHAKKFESYDVN